MYKAIRTRQIDINNISFDIYFNDQEIGYGQYNVRTNTAHISEVYNGADESELETKIESREIELE